jgi:hypothetical protein
LTKFVDSDRRRKSDRRGSDRRRSDLSIKGEDQRSGEDRRLAQRRLDYDRAVAAAKAALIGCGIDSAEFAAAVRASELARQRLSAASITVDAARL